MNYVNFGFHFTYNLYPVIEFSVLLYTECIVFYFLGSTSFIIEWHNFNFLNAVFFFKEHF